MRNAHTKWLHDNPSIPMNNGQKKVHQTTTNSIWKCVGQTYISTRNHFKLHIRRSVVRGKLMRSPRINYHKKNLQHFLRSRFFYCCLLCLFVQKAQLPTSNRNIMRAINRHFSFSLRLLSTCPIRFSFRMFSFCS